MLRRSRLISGSTLVAFFMSLFYPMGGIGHAFAETGGPVVAIVGYRTKENTAENRVRSKMKFGDKDKVRLVPDSVVAKYVRDLWELDSLDNRDRLKNAYKNFKKGKELYRKLKVDEAIVLLNSAVRGYREGLSSLRDNKYLLASHLYLGMALMIRGREKEGKEFIRQMIVLDAKRKRHRLPKEEFPPKIVQAHNKLTDQVSKGSMGTVVIQTTPKHAIVYFDGVKQPRSPMVIREVPVGDHFVMVEKAGHRQRSRRVVVKPGENKVRFNLEAWTPTDVYPFQKRSDPLTNTLLKNLANQLAAHILVLGSIVTNSKGDKVLLGQLYDSRSKEFSKIESQKMSKGNIGGAATKLSKKLREHLSVSGYVVAELSPGAEGEVLSTIEQRVEDERSSDSIDKKPLYKKWWFWAIVGGVAAGGAGTFFLIKQNSDPDFNVLAIDNPLAP